MIGKLARFFDDRLRAVHFARSSLKKIFPDHWSFMIGEIALYCFLVLVLTGLFLTLFFKPSLTEMPYQGGYRPLQGTSVSEAYHSVMDISFDVRAGLVMRQIHHWAALVFVAAIVSHFLRVFLTGAFRRPREINWIIGITLLVLAIFNGFTGYSLPDDLLSGTGLRIAHSVALSIPIVGTWLAFLIFGGEFPAHDIIARLYVMHILLVPGAMIGLLAMHLAIIWRQRHTQFPGKSRSEQEIVGSRLWPTYAAKSVGLFLFVFALLATLGGLAQINPVWLYGPFDPTTVTSPAQPDWYLGWVEGAMRLFPAWEPVIAGRSIPNPFFPAVLLPGLTFLMLYLWPFLEKFISRDNESHELLDRPRDRPFRTSFGLSALTFYIVLHLAASNDVIARFTYIPVETVTAIFQFLAILTPPVVFLITHRSMTALQVTEAKGLGHVPWRAYLNPRRWLSQEGSGK